MKSEPRDIIILKSDIKRALHINLTNLIKTKKKHNNCTVFLITSGGDPDAAYRIGRCLQHSYENVRLVVPWYCKSAGTLVCMAAHELIISDLGELGPLDVQLLRRDEVGDRSSGMDLVEAMGMIANQVTSAFRNNLLSIKNETRLSTKLAGDFAVRLATSIIEPLYSQIDPIRLGENQRATSIALQYGIRLSEKTNSISKESLMRLIAGYPSHGFVIDRKEAKTLFNKVDHPTPHEEKICDYLMQINLDESIVDLLEETEIFHEHDENNSTTEKGDCHSTPSSASNQTTQNNSGTDQPSSKECSSDSNAASN